MVSLCALGSSAAARAQEASEAGTGADPYAPPDVARPTSGEASFLSGRTLGSGDTLLAAWVGWPGFFVHAELAPDSLVNVGIRLGVTYGSPVMGLVPGAGGEAAAVIRIHVFGEGDVDLSVRLEPSLQLGEGVLFGEAGALGDDLGYSSRLDVGVVLGWRVVEHVTLYAGAGAAAGFSEVPSARNGIAAIGIFRGTLGIEALMSRDTMLFADVQAGGGVAPDRVGFAYYPDRAMLRVALGLAYLL